MKNLIQVIGCFFLTAEWLRAGDMADGREMQHFETFGCFSFEDMEAESPFAYKWSQTGAVPTGYEMRYIECFLDFPFERRKIVSTVSAPEGIDKTDKKRMHRRRAASTSEMADPQLTNVGEERRTSATLFRKRGKIKVTTKDRLSLLNEKNSALTREANTLRTESNVLLSAIKFGGESFMDRVGRGSTDSADALLSAFLYDTLCMNDSLQ